MRSTTKYIRKTFWHKHGAVSSYHLGIEARRDGQGIHYYHQDEQLSTALITNRTGEIQNHYQYDAFGKGLEQSEQVANRIRYTGQQYDVLMEKYYLQARYYNPILGRFMQEDVYQGDGLNLYAYCDNNPMTYYDPSGYKKCPPETGFNDPANDNSGKVEFKAPPNAAPEQKAQV